MAEFAARSVHKGWLAVLCGLMAFGTLCAFAQPAFPLDPLVLHAPPADYQPIGTCAPDLGRPYYNRQQQLNGPILFYAGTELTKVAYLMKARDVEDGQAVTILNEFAGLPVAEITFSSSQSNPFVNPPMRGSYYLLWLHLDLPKPRPIVSC